MREKGILNLPANFEAQKAAPIDARMVVSLKSDLILESTWQANDGGVYTYTGMIVSVSSDPATTNNGIYRLIDPDYTIESNWEKAGSGVSASGFLELYDTPSSYANMAASGVRVNNSSDGLEFYPIEQQTETDPLSVHLADIKYDTKWFVSEDIGSDDNDGLSDATPFATIEKAVENCSSNDLVEVLDSNTYTLTAPLAIPAMVTVSMPNAAIQGEISLSNSSRLIAKSHAPIANGQTMVSCIGTSGAAYTVYGMNSTGYSDIIHFKPAAVGGYIVANAKHITVGTSTDGHENILVYSTAGSSGVNFATDGDNFSSDKALNYGYPADLVYGDTGYSQWYTDIVGLPVTITYDNGTGITASSYKMKATSSGTRMPKNWKVYGQLAGGGWTELDSQSDITWGAYEEKEFTIGTTGNYDEYKIVVASSGHPTRLQIDDIGFWAGVASVGGDVMIVSDILTLGEYAQGILAHDEGQRVITNINNIYETTDGEGDVFIDMSKGIISHRGNVAACETLWTKTGGTLIWDVGFSAGMQTGSDPVAEYYNLRNIDGLKLDQSAPQTFTAGDVTGTGLLSVTAGVLGLDTTAYVSGTPWTSEGYITDISGQDLSAADNTTSQFITIGDVDLSGYALLSGATFTGNIEISKATPTFTLTDASDGSVILSRTAGSSVALLTNQVTVPATPYYSLFFDGDDISSSAFNFKTVIGNLGTMSMGCWVKLASTTGTQHIIGDYASGTDGSRLYTVNGNLRGTLGGTGYTTTFNLTADVWYHVGISFIYTGGVYTAKIYLNGSAQTFTNTVNYSYAAGFLIGGNTHSTKNYLNGYLDEMFVYSRVLADSDFTDLYNLGNGRYITPTGTFPTSSSSMGTNLVALYHFDEGTGTSTADSSGNGRNFATLTTPTWQTGKVPTPSTTETIDMIRSENSVEAGVYGVNTFGHSTGHTKIQGSHKIDFLNHTYRADNIKSYYGDDPYASIYADSTNLVINPKEVGIGYLSVLGDVHSSAFVTDTGTSSDFVKGDGSLDSSTYLTAEADTWATVMARGAESNNNANISKADPEMRLTDTGNNEYARWTRTDTYNETSHKARVYEITDAINVASGMSYSHLVAPNASYPDTGTTELTDGNVGGISYADAKWVGWLNNNPTTVIDLGSSKNLLYFSFHYLAATNVGVGAPSQVVVDGSNDNVNFSNIGTYLASGNWLTTPSTNNPYWSNDINFTGLYRYVKFTFSRTNSFTFLSELRIYSSDPIPSEETYLSVKDGTSVGYTSTITLGANESDTFINGLDISLLGDTHIGDNLKDYFGTADDASIYYDGTNLVINPKVVGSGFLAIEGSTVIDDTSTEALLVRKDADGGDVFIVDTTNSRIGVNVAPDRTLDLLSSTTSADIRFRNSASTTGFIQYASKAFKLWSHNILIATIDSSDTSQNFYVTPTGAFTRGMHVSGGSTASNNLLQSSSTGTHTGNNLNLGTSNANATGNTGYCSFVAGTTIGLNVGTMAESLNGNLNVGVLGKSVTAKNSATNIGLISTARNTGSSSHEVGAYVGLITATPTWESGALFADNGATTAPIFSAKDNGATVFDIIDGGDVRLRLDNQKIQLGTAQDVTLSYSGTNTELLNSVGSGFLKTNMGLWLDGNSGATPTSGAGTRLMWIPAKYSFRAGQVTGTQWDADNIGNYSVAIGYNTKASGVYSLAFNSATTASGDGSFAIGYGNSATGTSASALGYWTRATGQGSLAGGYNSSYDGTSITAGTGTANVGNGQLAFGYATPSEGIITGVSIDSPGAYYEVDDVISLDNGNYDCELLVTSVDGDGGITGVTIVSGGTGYPATSYIPVIGGSGELAEISVTSISAGGTVKAEGTGSIALGEDVNALTDDNVIAIGRGFDSSTQDSFSVGFGQKDFEVQSGKIFIYNLPTSDPHVAGQLWNSSGTIKVSAG